jgi:hypothetical protein
LQLAVPGGHRIEEPPRQPQRAKPGAADGCDPQPRPSRSSAERRCHANPLRSGTLALTPGSVTANKRAFEDTPQKTAGLAGGIVRIKQQAARLAKVQLHRAEVVVELSARNLEIESGVEGPADEPGRRKGNRGLRSAANDRGRAGSLKQPRRLEVIAEYVLCRFFV